MICIIEYGQQARLVSVITHRIPPVHKCCHVPLVLEPLMPF